MQISKSAIVSVIKETTCAIWIALQAKQMPSPTEHIFQEIAKDFNIRWNIPNCVGSIGGNHIRIKCPPNSGSQYRVFQKDLNDLNLVYFTYELSK